MHQIKQCISIAKWDWEAQRKDSNVSLRMNYEEAQNKVAEKPAWTHIIIASFGGDVFCIGEIQKKN